MYVGSSSRKSKWSAFLDEEEHSEDNRVDKKFKWISHIDDDCENKFFVDKDEDYRNVNLNQCLRSGDKWNCRLELHETESNRPPAFLEARTSLLKELCKLPVDNVMLVDTDITEMTSDKKSEGDFNENNCTEKNNLSVTTTMITITENKDDTRSSYNCFNLDVTAVNSSKLFSTFKDGEDIDSILNF